MPRNYNLYLKGYVGGWDFNADMVNYVLDKHKNEEVSVLIDSLGGNAATALSISSLFQLHGNVHCHYVGMNASAATIASMGAKRITMDSNALFLVHKCMVEIFEWDYMNADELAAHIADLEKKKKDNQTIDCCVAGLYAKRCKKTKDELLALMKEGAWLTAEQALEWGFVDEVVEGSPTEKPELTAAAAADLVTAGVPLPPLSVKKDSVMERILRVITNYFNNSPRPATADDTAKDAKPTLQMKTLTNLEATLGTAVAVADGSVTLTVEQAEALNDSLGKSAEQVTSKENLVAEKEAEIAELRASVAALQNKVDALSQEPAATTGEITPSAEDEVDMSKVVEALINSIR